MRTENRKLKTGQYHQRKIDCFGRIDLAMTTLIAGYRYLLSTDYRSLSAIHYSLFTIHHSLFTVFCLLFSLLLFSKAAFAEVMVYDGVTIPEKNIRLKAVTKGRFFPEGGKLVEFYLDGVHIGTKLSGGDGYAFADYLSFSTGIKRIKLKSGADTDEGTLLVVVGTNLVLLVELEGALFESPYPFKPVKGSRDALQSLSKTFSIVYLTSKTDLKKSRQWVKDNGLPPSAVLQWKGADIFDELQRQGIKLHAIIGSPEVVSDAPAHIKKRFTFEDTENAVTVKDWNELLKNLR